MEARYKAINPKGEGCGHFAFGQKGFELGIDADDGLRQAFAGIKDGGLSARQEVLDEASGNFLLCAVPVRSCDPGFGQAFADHLEKLGYKVARLHPETVEEFTGLLYDIPDSEKAGLVEDFKSKTYLEQTAILEIMKDDAAPAPSI